ncbi:hypothetical protein HZB94_04630 [Candidatus Falkowbacteria bacterium]|nr:hypothetical protein [Candidatus Falkowbacteria bacterium]
MLEKNEGAASLRQNGAEKSMHEKAMEGLLKRAEETSREGKTSFENAVLSLLESDGYSGGMYPALEDALRKRNIAELIRVAHMDGWL